MSIKSRIKKKLSANTGTSMIEVLVAFLVVMLMMAMFSKVVMVSVDLLERSRKTMARAEQFNETYYQTETIKKRETMGAGVILAVDSEKTDAKNKALAADLPLAKVQLKKCQIELSDPDVRSMVRYSFGSLAEQENPDHE